MSGKRRDQLRVCCSEARHDEIVVRLEEDVLERSLC